MMNDALRRVAEKGRAQLFPAFCERGHSRQSAVWDLKRPLPEKEAKI